MQMNALMARGKGTEIVWVFFADLMAYKCQKIKKDHAEKGILPQLSF